MPGARFGIVLPACFVACMGTASAQLIDWDSGGLNNSWHNSVNWNAMPARIPNEDDTARIGNLAAAANDTVTLGANAVAGELQLSSGADVDTNGYSLDVGDITAGTGLPLSELIVRPASMMGALPYSVSANDVTFSSNGQLTMRGGRLELVGGFFDQGILTINSGAELFGHGTISVGAFAGIAVAGLITVGESQPVFGEPPSRTLEIEVPGVTLGSIGLGEVVIRRNSTLLFSLNAGPHPLIRAEEVTLSANTTIDFDDNAGQFLNSGGSLIVNSGPSQIGMLILPAIPAVIRGTEEFYFDNAEIVLDQSDEALTFDVLFRHVGGDVLNDGTIRYNAGAEISAAAAYVTGGFGQLVNGESSQFNLADGANVDSPITNHGTITIDADSEGQAVVDALTLSESSALEFDLRTVIPGQFDALVVEGNAVLDGTLVVSPDPAFTALVGNTFTILSTTFGIISGTFETEMLPVVDGLTFEVLYPDPQTVVLRVSPAFTADFDEDGDVDSDDLAQWQGDFGANALSDADDDGDSDGDDFLQWQQQVGSPLPTISSVSPIPEPGGAKVLLGAALLVPLARRRFIGLRSARSLR